MPCVCVAIRVNELHFSVSSNRILRVSNKNQATSPRRIVTCCARFIPRSIPTNTRPAATCISHTYRTTHITAQQQGTCSHRLIRISGLLIRKQSLVVGHCVCLTCVRHLGFPFPHCLLAIPFSFGEQHPEMPRASTFVWSCLLPHTACQVLCRSLFT